MPTANEARKAENVLNIAAALEAVRLHLDHHEELHEQKAAKARKAKEQPDAYEPLRAQSITDTGVIANILREAMPPWVTNEELDLAHGSPVPRVLEAMKRLRSWPEFEVLKGVVIELRWMAKNIVVRDVVMSETRMGAAKAVPLTDRLTWLGSSLPPLFRFELSLPYVLLATDSELDRGLHHLLCACGLSNGRPIIRKPDIIGYSATLGRYGAQGWREVSAVAHAHANSGTHAEYKRYEFDATTGQGLLWREDVPRQGDLVEAANVTKMPARKAV